MNSKLNMELREKRGFVYSIGSQFVPFSDMGIFAITFGTEPTQIEKAVNLVKREMKKLMDEPMGTRQLSTAKEQFMGQVAMAEENNGGFMMMMARSILDLGRIPSLDDLFKQVRHATAQEVQNLAQQMLDSEEMSLLVMEPGSK